MNWRDPKKELPSQGQRVWVMLEPHKVRGSLLDSAMSIQVVCGEACYAAADPQCLEIQNMDELGEGGIGWSFEDYAKDCEYGDYQPRAIAWIPVEEMFEKHNTLESVEEKIQMEADRFIPGSGPWCKAMDALGAIKKVKDK